MSTPDVMTNNFAAAKIINGKSQVAVAFICFKQSVVCVRSKKLGGKKENFSREHFQEHLKYQNYPFLKQNLRPEVPVTSVGGNFMYSFIHEIYTGNQAVHLI